MANTYLTRTPSGAGNGNTWTFSAWVKKGNPSATQFLIGSSTSASDFEDIRFNATTGELSYVRYLTTKQWGFDSSTNLRDVNGWYHILVNRNGTTMNYYLNGVSQTKTNETTSTSTGDFNTTDELRIGGRPDTTSYTFDGIMSHVHWIDGTAYDASAFGSTDSTTGEWKINTSPSVTYGTNGFFILKDGNSVTDQSGNSNNFTVGSGTLTKTEDCPSNVFATLNPLYPYTSTGAITNGNTVPSDYAAYQGIVGTLGASSGKYYFEVKINGSSGERGMVGWGARDTGQITFPGGGAYDYGRLNNADTYYNNGSDTAISGASAYTTNDICGCAIDLDGNKIYWYKNGALENTGGTTITASSTAGNYFPIVRNGDGNNIQCNFGNGYFGTTAVSSAGTNASGIGIFEYDVPNGYTALSTKGLNE